MLSSGMGATACGLLALLGDRKNIVVAPADDDRGHVDAGEIGSGQSVTALYEVELQGKEAQVEQAAQQQTAALLMSADSPDITTEPYLIIVIPQAMSPLLPEIPGVPEQEERVLMDATAHPVPAAQAAPAVTAARSPALAQALPI